MNSTSIKIKRFFQNKNTVVLLCAIIGVIVLYVGYNMRIQSAIEPVSIPYAKVTIQPRTKITDDMIGYMEVASAAVDKMGDNIIICDKDSEKSNSCADKLMGKYSNINTMIPQGSMFYNSAVVSEDSLPDSSVYKVPKGEVLYYMTVNMASSYVNSIVPGGYIDLYVRTGQNSTAAVQVGKFIENIKVLAVKTSDGLDVFENSDEQRVPHYVIFSIPKEQHTYLLMASKLGLEVIPVPINVSLIDDMPETSQITSMAIIEYITSLGEEFMQDEIIENPNPENPTPEQPKVGE